MAESTVVIEPAKQQCRNLEGLFSPRSIAVVGASRKEGSVGRAIMRNLVVGDYQGVVYPINPNAKSILGVRCVPEIDALDETVDLAVMVLPATVIEEAMIQLADRGTKNFVVISAGFKEVGGEGVKRETRLRELARQRGLAVLGPNCLGVINTASDVRMNATFATGMPDAGNIGLLSQSGALCTAILDYARGRNIGFSRFISFGNKVDINEVELLWSLAEDPNTHVILMYIEDLSDGQAFLQTAYEITHRSNPKPVLAIKTGRTPQGAAAAASHTGSLAGSDEVYDAVMSQAGVVRVESIQEMFDFAGVFSDPVMPKGRRTAIVTNAGGPGIMATDACIRYGLQLAKFREYTTKSLRFQLPPSANINNPVDVIGDARHDRYRSALDAVCADDGVDQIVVLLTPQSMTDITEIANVVAETKEFCDKPIVACMMGSVDVAPGVEILKHRGVPTFVFPEDAMRSLAAKCQFAEWSSAPTRPPRRFEVNRGEAEALLASEIEAGRSQLIELRALEVLKHYGMPLVPFRLAKDADEAVAAANEIGYPVVLKIVSPVVLHKTEVGGVRLNLENDDSLREAYEGMMAAVRSKMGSEIDVWGGLVQKMLPVGKEIILGMTRDDRFGPLLMFGLGGIYTEALRDVAFRLAPIRENVAAEMVKDIRSHRLLEGLRGEPPSDTGAIAECLMRLSQLVTDHPRIKELDINPLIVYPHGKGAVVADARIILSEE
ncbi:MAG: acetate--CoA ligase family protein [Phycisphaerae bacterium]|nr:acetate--CoA ligase family protein [Phycisphaerae bacterium]